MLKITKTKLIYYLTLLCSVLAGYFAFTDLQISISLVDTSSGWARFLEKFGEIPGLLVLYSGTLISLLHYLSGSHKLKLIFLPLVQGVQFLQCDFREQELGIVEKISFFLM